MSDKNSRLVSTYVNPGGRHSCPLRRHRLHTLFTSILISCPSALMFPRVAPTRLVAWQTLLLGPSPSFLLFYAFSFPQVVESAVPPVAPSASLSARNFSLLPPSSYLPPQSVNDLPPLEPVFPPRSVVFLSPPLELFL